MSPDEPTTNVAPVDPVATPPVVDPAVVPEAETVPAPEPAPADQGAATAVPPVTDTLTSAPLPENPSSEPTPADVAPVTDAESAPAPEETPVAADAASVAPTVPAEAETPVEEAVELNAEAERHEEEASEELREAQRDLTPVEEAQASTDTHIDGSNIGVETNQDLIDNHLPRNERGQVEIDSEGHIVGLNDDATLAAQAEASEPSVSSIE